MTILDSTRRALHDYYLASSVQEALAYLIAHHGEAQLVGGGTALMPQVQRGECLATRLVDVSGIQALRGADLKGESLIIGGAATFERLLQSDVVRRTSPLLHEAAQSVGTPELRHLATLAGNVVTAEGNAQGSVALLALGAQAEITNVTGAQWLALESLFVRPGVSRVDSMSEIVTSFRLPAMMPGQGSALECLPSPARYARSPLVLALAICLEEHGQAIEWASVAIGSAQAVPSHLPDVDQALSGLPVDDPRSRQTFVSLIDEQSSEDGALEGFTASLSDAIPPLAARAFQRAVESARRSLRASPS